MISLLLVKQTWALVVGWYCAVTGYVQDDKGYEKRYLSKKRNHPDGTQQIIDLSSCKET